MKPSDSCGRDARTLILEERPAHNKCCQAPLLPRPVGKILIYLTLKRRQPTKATHIIAAAVSVSLLFACANDQPVRDEVASLRHQVDTLKAATAAAERRAATAEAELARRDASPSSRESAAAINASNAFCCQITYQLTQCQNIFAPSTIEARRLIASGQAIVDARGKIWPRQDHDPVWLWAQRTDLPPGGWPDAPDFYSLLNWCVRIADRRVDSVIRTSRATEATAIVEFTWHYELTEAGKAMESKLPVTGERSGRARLRRFDDGWRVDAISLGEPTAD